MLATPGGTFVPGSVLSLEGQNHVEEFQYVQQETANHQDFNGVPDIEAICFPAAGRGGKFIPMGTGGGQGNFGGGGRGGGQPAQFHFYPPAPVGNFPQGVGNSGVQVGGAGGR
ncbi:MAG: hypothetical protein CXT75_12075 [Methanobacteriota archaeon]|nr:MAG: hypothetical protein CXT75_12075 [Euryarchaeota archaeon]